MAKLDAAARKRMPASDFAAGKGHFPINDATHARLAISGATRAERAGHISSSEEASIKSKARAKLRAFHGHEVHGAFNSHGLQHEYGVEHS